MSHSERDSLLSKPVKGFSIYDAGSVADLISQFGGTSFQSRKLYRAAEIYKNMLTDKGCTIFMGIAGAMIPAGQGRLIAQMIREKMVDVIFSTGAQVYHDFYEVLGGEHFVGTEHADDDKLRELGIDRIYDTYGDDAAYQNLDNEIERACSLLPEGNYSSWELITHFYNTLSKGKKPKEGMTRAAVETGLPIFIPTFHDSSLMFGLVKHYVRTGRNITLDYLRDLLMHIEIHRQSKTIGGIYIGGGVPKNHIQQITPIR
ncbi:MAG TPA: deoxyhypusine synthase family protein, partial [Bdellovibrionota bacterium]|nr:deoxyhypusine synthase family protein [Bdellovibrionota bacterium]